jgi:allophanate hydrolase subunit 1
MESPGGWQLIGRTPLRLFDPKMGEKGRYQAGDSIRFVPISQKEFDEISQTPEMRW